LPSNIDKQLGFAQQIHIRATGLGQNEIIQLSREYMQANYSSFFNILWARVRDKSALIRTLEGHSSSVGSVAITPDGTKIVSGSADKTIKVWDLNNGSIIFACKFDSHISAIAISKNKIFWDLGTLMVMFM
jgi:WD40 repeat protein